MTYLIDYRVGGMGNTIVAHIMYACHQWDLDLDNFFSPRGDAHQARKFWQQAPLKPVHMLEQPNEIPDQSICIVEVQATSWYKLVEFKMAYSKYSLAVPDCSNFEKFYRIDRQTVDTQADWQSFYQNVKDPSWPPCASWDDLSQLPLRMQQEVKSVYQPPKTGVNQDNFVSLLTIAYFDELCKFQTSKPVFGGKIFLLNNYFANQLDVLSQTVSTELGWTWDQERSSQFHQRAMLANQRYCDWLANLQQLATHTLQEKEVEFELEPWEKSLLLAQICVQCNIDPRELLWDSIGKLNSNRELITVLRNKHGKTI